MSDDSQGMPDLDLIARVQQARMQHDAEVMPSQVSAVYWIETARRTAGPPPTPRAGHFSITTTIDQVDALWQRVREATEAGSLGYKARSASRDGPDPARICPWKFTDASLILHSRAIKPGDIMPVHVDVWSDFV
ncbi:MAG: hypothetical protein IPK19_19805 [Chloroflexi bacterium]|nr:hypothetical protein [Chloroflexota bacterium]